MAWSEKEECFYVNFRNITDSGDNNTKGIFRFSYDFLSFEQLPLNYGSMSRQGLYVEKESGNII